MPPVARIAKHLGSHRAAFYKQLLERAKKFIRLENEGVDLDGFLKSDKSYDHLEFGSKERKEAVDRAFNEILRRPSVKELTDQEGFNEVKNQLRYIDDSVFEDLDRVMPPLGPYNFGTEGFYNPKKNRVSFDYEFMTSPSTKAVPHELWHHVQNKEGRLPLNSSDVERSFIEAEADQFTEEVMKRSKGGKREDIPKKFLPYILGLIGAFMQSKEEQ